MPNETTEPKAALTTKELTAELAALKEKLAVFEREQVEQNTAIQENDSTIANVESNLEKLEECVDAKLKQELGTIRIGALESRRQTAHRAQAEGATIVRAILKQCGHSTLSAELRELLGEE